MLFPESWLRSVVNPSVSTEELSHLLTMSGLEIEDVLPVAPEFSGVVVARVEEVSPHPDADRLRVCRVNNGTEILQIVCGAPNVAAGLLVPLAQIGARLPGGIKISKGKLRGVESFGMLCSATEIGLTQEHDGLLILDPEQAQLGQDIRDLFQLDESIFELKITPNRADCLSIKGVAREVVALTGASAKPFDFSLVSPTITDTLPVRIEAPDLCGRFLGRVIRNVNAAVPTPEWIKRRLERAGQRSVSVLVDISNYVMLELGTPSHIFDLDKLPTPEIVVDWGRSGQKLTLLNGDEVELDEKVGVVYSGAHTPEAMAGVMGGLASAVSEQTTQIFIEQAFWYPHAIAGLTRRFKLNSEAAHRFERGVDFACLRDHLEYLTRLIVEICGGEVAPIIELSPNLPERQPVKMRVARCHQILGIKIPVERMGAIFSALQFEHSFDGQVFEVVPPSWRFDIEIEEDLIEEVARIYGFDQIPANPPVVSAVMLPAVEGVRRPHALRQILVAQDYQEVINFSFVPEQWEVDFAQNTQAIKLLNPIASQLSVMRSNLIAGLVDNVVYNVKRKFNRVRVFELGAVFRRDAQVSAGDLTVKGIDQPLHLAGVAWGLAEPEQWGLPARAVDFFDVKADVCALFPMGGGADLRFEARTLPALHPGRSAVIYYQGREVGYMGELHPSLVQTYDLPSAPVVFELEYAALENVPLPAPEAFSKQPMVIRDLAIWAPLSLPVQALLDKLAQSTAPELKLIQDVTLFDIWRDPAQPTERSLAFRLVLQDSEHTLEDAQVEQCMSTVLELWTKAYGVRQR